MSFDLKIINGDLVIRDGDLDTVSGQDKLVQDVLKICITPAGANVNNPWYGSLINQTLIGSYLDSDVTETIARNQLQDCLNTLKKLQQIQVNNLNQKVTPDELIASIADVLVKRNEIDPRIYQISIKVINQSFNRIPVSFPIQNF